MPCSKCSVSVARLKSDFLIDTKRVLFYDRYHTSHCQLDTQCLHTASLARVVQGMRDLRGLLMHLYNHYNNIGVTHIDRNKV